MKREIRTCHSSDGFALRFRHYSLREDRDSTTEGVPIHGAVVAVHGIQSHSGWYRESSVAMANAGWDVYFADRRGSGLNGRDRGHADSGLRLLNDLKMVVQLAHDEHPGLPVTLLGLSWGGKLAAAFAAEFPDLVQRLMLLYPATDPIVRPNWIQSFLLKTARRHDIRKRLVPLPFTDAQWFTNVAEYQNRIADDPLALNSVTTGFLNATRDLDRIIESESGSIRVPLLLMLAEQDRIIDNCKVKARVQSWPSPDLSVIQYPDAEHTLEFCSRREAFFQDLAHWLSRSLATDAIQMSKAADQQAAVRRRQ